MRAASASGSAATRQMPTLSSLKYSSPLVIVGDAMRNALACSDAPHELPVRFAVAQEQLPLLQLSLIGRHERVQLVGETAAIRAQAR